MRWAISDAARLGESRTAITALDAGDAEGLRVAAHALKGASLMLGANALSRAAQVVESIGRSGDLAAAPAAVATLEDELERLWPRLSSPS